MMAFRKVPNVTNSLKSTIETTDDSRKYGKEMIDMIADYHDNIAKLPVVPDVKPGYIRDLLPSKPPQTPQNYKKIINTFNEAIVPGLTQWHSPQFHAYYPIGNSYPSLLGGILGDAIGCAGFSWKSNPACTELEVVTMDWFAKMLDLPKVFMHSLEGHGGGIIQTSASESALVSLLAAKSRMLKTKDSDSTKFVAYCSEQAHSSIERAAMLAHVPIKKVKTDHKYSMEGDTLEKQTEIDIEAGLSPLFIAATLGTTSLCSFDKVDEIGKVCKKYPNLWLHVDTAYAGSAFICPEYRYLSKGLDQSDSFVVNFNKWMMVNLECSALYLRNSKDFTDSYNVDPLYLKHEHQETAPDFRHWQIPLSRSFRSLKLWMVLMAYGVEGLQQHIRYQIKMAKYFETLLVQDIRLEIFHDVIMGLVCFRLKGANDLN